MEFHPIIWHGKFAKALAASGFEFNDNTRVISGALNPVTTATDAPSGSIYVSTATAHIYIKQDNGSSTNWKYLPLNTDVVLQLLANFATTPATSGLNTISASDSILNAFQKAYGNDIFLNNSIHRPYVIDVAVSGGLYNTIQDGIDAASGATPSTPYLVRVFPGIYTEDITLDNDVFIVNGAEGDVTVEGTVTGNITTSASIVGFNFSYAPTGNDVEIIAITGTDVHLENIHVNFIGTGDFSVIGIHCTSTAPSGDNFVIRDCTIHDERTAASITQNFTGFWLAGSGSVINENPQVIMEGKYTSGTHKMIRHTSTGYSFADGGLLSYIPTGGTFSGYLIGHSMEATSTVFRAVNNKYMRFIGTGNSGVTGGSCVAFYLNSGSGDATTDYTDCAYHVTGFQNERITDTASGDTQKVWNCNTNKVFTKYGDGLAIVMPQDEVHSGFVEWSTVGSTYWSFVPGTRVLTVPKRFTGLVKSAPVLAPSGQTFTITNFATNTIYATSSGALSGTTSETDDLYENNIPILQIYSDGTNYLVKKENHHVKVSEGISRVFGSIVGPVLYNNGGGNLTTLVAASRTIKMVTATSGMDHGLATLIPDSGGAALTFTGVYTGTSGMTIDTSAVGVSAIPGRWQNSGTTVANAASNQRIVVRIGVLLDNLNSTAPQYVFVYHNVQFGTNAAASTAAENAIAAGTITAFPSALNSMEVIQLGYAVLIADGAGGGTLDTSVGTNGIVIAKQVNGTSFNAGAASTSAGTVVTDTSSFAGELTTTEASVQTALNRLDLFDSTLDWTTGRTYRVGNVVRVTTSIGEGFTGNWRATSGHTAGTLTTDINAGAWEIVSNSEGARELISSSAASGFVAGDLVYYTGSDYAKAIATSASGSQVVGMVTGATTNKFVLAKTGKITKTGWGRTAGETYYLSATTPGAMTTTEPTGVNYSVKLGTATSTTEFQLHLSRFLIDAATGTSGIVTTGTQSFAGAKTFTANPTLSAMASSGIVHNAAGGLLSSSLIVNADVHASAAIEGSKIVTATTGVAGVVDTNAQSFAGLKTFTSGLSAASGTSSAPTITFTGDTNTGFFWKSADSVGFAASGVEVGSWSSSGLFTFGPAVTGDNFSAGKYITVNGSIWQGSTSTTDAYKSLIFGTNAYLGAAGQPSRDSNGSTLGGAAMVLMARTADTSSCIRFYANKITHGNTDSVVSIGEADQNGAWALGPAYSTGAGYAAGIKLRGYSSGSDVGTATVTVDERFSGSYNPSIVFAAGGTRRGRIASESSYPFYVYNSGNGDCGGVDNNGNWILGQSTNAVKTGCVNNTTTAYATYVGTVSAATSLQDDYKVTVTTNGDHFGWLVHVSVNQSGTLYSGLFFMSYDTTTVTKLGDPSGYFQNFDSDGNACVYRTDANNTFVVKNRRGATYNYYISVIGTSLSSITAPAA